MLRSWRCITIVLAALALTMTSAHVLELPQKMQYEAQLYSAVNTTMYRYFAVVGGVYSIGSIVAAGVLACLVRNHRPAFWWALTGAVLLVLWFVSWLALVAPVNKQVAAALQSAPESVPEIWMRLRERWEYGHAAGFVIQLLGFGALVISVVVETPKRVVSNQMT
jgi:Domain of unknown function (DUF1772)